ncbi:hypothetical protein D6827_02790 [Candidatus Parcubacteria bacterium]|nr:MAG: hypothetical protein D6827_02790 [Candidatus Parcubacteria bacterium]
MIFCFIVFSHIFGSQNIKKLSLPSFAKGETKKDWLAKLRFAFGFAKTNFQLQNQNISFSPRGAWQIVAKWGFGARSAPAERLCREANNTQNTEFVKWRYCLDEILTFFEQNPEDFAD